jgi:hypothetical protein
MSEISRLIFSGSLEKALEIKFSPTRSEFEWFTRVRASLAEPVKSETEKHEFDAPNSCLRAGKWQAQKEPAVLVYGLCSAPAASEPVKTRFMKLICI